MQMSLGRTVVNERLARAFELHRAEKRFSAERDARYPLIVDDRRRVASRRSHLPSRPHLARVSSHAPLFFLPVAYCAAGAISVY